MIAVTIVAISLALGTFLVTGWLSFNAEKTDDALLRDVAGAAAAVRCAYHVNGETPQTLADAAKTITSRNLPNGLGPCMQYTDTLSWPYIDWRRNEVRHNISSFGNVEYIRGDRDHIEICATFKKPSSNLASNLCDYEFLPSRPVGGRYCYAFDLAAPPSQEDRYCIAG